MGDKAPAVFEDFPVMMSPYVDDFANLSLEIRYLKNVSENDSSIFTITDMNSGQTVYSEELDGGVLYTDNLDMDKYYRVTITEQFNGEETKEYTKYMSTSYEQADMPDYVFEPASDDTSNISIIDTEKYTLATTIDENGATVFDADIAEFTNIPANEWQAYIETLEADKLYKVETGNGAGTKTGFISTYDWGKDLGIYMPGYSLYSEDISQAPMPMANFDPSSISESMVTMSQETYAYGDTLFTASSSVNYKVIRYILTDEDDARNFEVWINASMPFYLQTWYKRASDSKVTRIYGNSYCRSGNKNYETVFLFDNEYLEEGDTVYFIIYNPSYKGIEGSICLQNMQAYTDDETGSAYEQYSNDNSISIAPYSPGYNETTIQNQYGLTRYMQYLTDVDTFFLDNTSGNEDSYSIVFNNTGQLSSDGEQDGTAVEVSLYYVDFDDDSHFVLKKKASTRINARDDTKDESWNATGKGSISFAPLNDNTKYFIEVTAISLGEYDRSEYSFYAMLYPNS